MGGIGSGRYYLGGGRTVVEDCRRLYVRRLQREGYLEPGMACTWAWSDGDGKQTGCIDLRAEYGAVVLSYRYRGYGEDWQAVDQRVPLTWTPCRLGGRRPWVVCDVYAGGVHCGRRAALLYGAGRLFACRRCYGLAYACQNERPWDRALRRADKIRRKLGGEPGTASLLPPRPRGMHRRTYERLTDEIFAAESLADQRVLRFLERYERRSGGGSR